MGYNGIASFQRNLGAWIVLEKSPCFGGCKSLSTGFLVKSESLRIPGCPASSERWNRTQILHLSGHRRSGSAWGPEGWFIKKWHPFSISSVMFFFVFAKPRCRRSCCCVPRKHNHRHDGRSTLG